MYCNDFQIYDSTDVVMTMAQIKESQNLLFGKTFFLNSDFRNGMSKY